MATTFNDASSNLTINGKPAGGVSDAAALEYVPGNSGDWTSPPETGGSAIDELASRMATVEGQLPQSASVVTFTPSTLANWTGSADPGDVDDALNQLASRLKVLELVYDFVVDSAADFDTAFDLAGTYAGKNIYIVPGTYTIDASKSLYFHSGMRIDWGVYGGGTYPTAYQRNVAISLGSGSGFLCKDALATNNAYQNFSGRLDRTNSMTVANINRLVVDTTAAAPAAVTFPANVVSGGSSPCVSVNGIKYPIVSRDSDTQLTLSGNNRDGLNTGVFPVLYTCFTDTIENIQMRGSLYLTSADLPSDSACPFQMTGFNHDLSQFTLKIDFSRGYEAGPGLARFRVVRSVIGPIEIVGQAKTVSAFTGAGTYYNLCLLIAGSQNTEFKRITISNIKLTQNVVSRSGVLYMIDARLVSACNINVHLTLNENNAGTGSPTTNQGLDLSFAYRTVYSGSYGQCSSAVDTATVTTNALSLFSTWFLST